MSKIEVHYSYIKINDYNQGDSGKLESYFRIWNPTYHRAEFHHIKFATEEHALYLPRGMDIWLLEKIFDERALYINAPSPFRQNPKIAMKFPPRDAKQSETLKFLTGVQEYRDYKNYSQYLVALSPGVGKTYVSTAYMAYMGLKTLVVSYNLSDQWKERILQYTDIRPQEIYIIQGMPSINSLLRKSPEELDSKYKVYLASSGTLRSLMDKFPGMLDQLIRHLGIGIKIFDEAHKEFENMCMIDYASDVYKTIYLTATPVRNDEKENDIYGIFFKNVPKISLFDEADKHVKYLALRFTSNPTYKDVNHCMTARGFNRVNYANYVINKPEFYGIMLIVLDMCRRMNGKKLIYLSSNESILKLYNWMTTDLRLQYLWDKVGIYTSISTDKVGALEKEYILTTSKSAGEGLDVAGLICGINLADPTQSEPLNRQRLERVRARGYFIDVIDEGFNTLLRYFYSNQKIYANYALSTSQLSYTRKGKLPSAVNDVIKKFPITSEQLFGRCRESIKHRNEENGDGD